MQPLDKNKIPNELQNRWILLWDGECGFCRRSVEWVLRQDKEKKISALPFQSAKEWISSEILGASQRQAHLVSPTGEVLGGGDAAIKILEIIGHSFSSKVLALPVISSLTGLGYRLVAQNRRLASRLFYRPKQKE
jgi:predicted DCC family thiol-disulfide oxidoreductase YuxK